MPFVDLFFFFSFCWCCCCCYLLETTLQQFRYRNISLCFRYALSIEAKRLLTHGVWCVPNCRTTCWRMNHWMENGSVRRADGGRVDMFLFNEQACCVFFCAQGDWGGLWFSCFHCLCFSFRCVWDFSFWGTFWQILLFQQSTFSEVDTLFNRNSSTI